MPKLLTSEKLAYDAIALEGITEHDVREKDYTLNIPSSDNLGNNLTRVDIELCLTDAGLPLPANTVSFRVYDASANIFLVTYIQSVDTYVYVKLKAAG